MINFRVGILGAGSIAETIADTLNKLDSFEPYAIASRDLARANEFADKFNIEKRYGSYEELVDDPDVELIYIATPHSHHAEQAKLCINAGKPVLVEKAFSYNRATAEEVFKLAEEKKVFCGEAMWIRFLPMYKKLFETLKSNVIGRVCSITCSLGYDLRDKERLLKPELAGGALLDLGVYPINLMCMFYGRRPDAVASTCIKNEAGLDAQEVISFNFKGGQSGSAVITMMYKADNNAKIYGTSGYIEIDNINCPEQIRMYKNDGQLVATMERPEKQLTGYEFEFISARAAIITGLLECPEITHAETLTILDITDSLRNAWKIRFPMEPEQPKSGPDPIMLA